MPSMDHNADPRRYRTPLPPKQQHCLNAECHHYHHHHQRPLSQILQSNMPSYSCPNHNPYQCHYCPLMAGDHYASSCSGVVPPPAVADHFLSSAYALQGGYVGHDAYAPHGGYLYNPSPAAVPYHHTAGSLPAPEAQFGIGAEAALGRHSNVKHRQFKKSFHCDVCELDCNNQDVLNNHKLGKKHERKVLAMKRNIMASGSVADSINECRICNVVCNSQSALDSHLAGKKHSDMVNRSRG